MSTSGKFAPFGFQSLLSTLKLLTLNATSLPRPTVSDAATMPLSDGHATLVADRAVAAELAELAELWPRLLQLAGAQGGAARLWSRAGDQLLTVYQIGMPEPTAHDLPHLHRGRSDSGGEALLGAPPPQFLAVPISHRGRVLGQLELFFATAPQANDVATGALFPLVGELLGLALHHMHPHDLQQTPPEEGVAMRAALLSQRQTMAAEVHDSVAQTLAFVKMRMPLLHEAITAQDVVSAVRYCDDVRQAVGTVHTKLRQLLSEFRVPMDPQGLKHALQSSILMFTQRTQVALDFDDQAPELHLSAPQESQVFHIVQEALTNIAKHASARRAWLSIKQVVGYVEVVVEDDGTGVAPNAVAPSGHFGVDIMRERAVRLGGHLDIGPRRGGGMRVHLSFPLTTGPAAAVA